MVDHKLTSGQRVDFLSSSRKYTKSLQNASFRTIYQFITYIINKMYKHELETLNGY